MFSSLARLRAVAFTIFLLLSFSHARDESLFTSSVTYCNPPETLLIQQFDVAYISKNNSVSFNIIAASVEANVNVTANLLLNFYGMNPVNLTVDLCGILGGALCPLPKYNFNGSDSISLPDSFGSQIPGIAFKIPDLEAFAQLTLTEVGTGDIKACVQATLSNGWSTHQRAVEWSVGCAALVAFLLALWQSRSLNALGPYRLLDLMGLYQIIAASALWNLNYPSVYRSFALNFAWALTLFSSPTSQLQQSINNMRALTGGALANSTSSSAVGFVNRKLSPFNSNAVSSSGGISLVPPVTFQGLSRLSTLVTTQSQPLPQQLAAVTNEVQTVTEASSNVLEAGLPIYVNSINIATANAFMTVFICTLILIAIVGFLVGVGYVVLHVMDRYRTGREDFRLELRYSFPSYVKAWSLRLGMIMLSPILIFAFYQWTLKDSWLSVFFSVFTFLGALCCVCYPSFFVFRIARRSGPSALYAETDVIGTSAPLYWQYRTQRYYFFTAMLLATFLRALFISAARVSGFAQVVLTLLVELAILAGLLILRPHKTRGADVFSTYLAITRVVCTGLMFAFVESFAVQAIPRVAIGIVITVIFSITVLVVIFNLALHSEVDRFWKRNTSSRPASRQESADTMLEKGDQSAVRSQHDATSFHRRAANPTPDRNIPLDPSINKPYSPTTPTTIDCASTRDRDSASTNFGSVLPRRWSFTPLHTPTDSSALDHITPSYSSTILSTTPEEHPVSNDELAHK